MTCRLRLGDAGIRPSRKGNPLAVPAIILALVFAITFLATPTLGGGWYWDLGNGLGFLALAGLLFQSIPGRRPRDIGAHEWLGYAVFAIATSHAFWFLLGDPVVRVYLAPGAPAHMWLGLAGLLMLALLTLLARMPDRTRIHPRYRSFRTAHRWLAVATVAASVLHVLMTRFYLSGWLQALLLTLLALAACFGRRYWTRLRSLPRPAPAAAYLAIATGAVGLFALLRNAVA